MSNSSLSGQIRKYGRDLGLNVHVMAVRTAIFQHYNRLLETGKIIATDAVKNSHFGITEKNKTIMEVFQYHNDQMKSLIDKDYSFGTHERYATASNYTKEFIEYKYNFSDYPIKQGNHEFITVYEYF